MALLVRRSPFDKNILDLQEREFGHIKSHGKESKRFFQVGFVPWVPHPFHVDGTEFAVVHGVSACKPSKTVPFDEQWYSAVEQSIHCREWLNSSVLSAPSVAELEYRHFLKVLTPLRRKRNQNPDDDHRNDDQREAEAIVRGEHLMMRCLLDRLGLYQREFDFSFDARTILERSFLSEVRTLVRLRFKNRSGWIPQG